MTGGSIDANAATSAGGGFYTDDDATVLRSEATDWGSDMSDNTPDDLSGWGLTFDDLGLSESFACDATGCR